MWRKGNHCALLVEMQTGAATVKNSMEFPEKIKNGTSLWSSNSPSGYLYKEILYIKKSKMLIWKNIFTPMCIAALFTRAKLWKQPKCPSKDQWIKKKLWYMYTMEYYLAIKKNEILPFATVWMDLEDLMLSEVSQRKTNTIWYHLYVESKGQYKQTNKTETDSSMQRTECWSPEGEGLGDWVWKVKRERSADW